MPPKPLEIQAKDVAWPKYQMPKDQFLTNDNYPTWKNTWESVMVSAGIPITTVQDIKLDMVTDMTVAWKLKETITKDLMGKIGLIAGGTEVWSTLKTMLGHQGPAKIMLKLDNFLDLKMKKDAVEYCSQFKMLSKELHALSLIIPKALELVMFLRGVGDAMPEWTARQRQAMRTENTKQTLDGLINDLTDEVAISKKSTGRAMNTNQNGGGKHQDSDDWKQNIECYNCGKKGHLKRDCRKEGGGAHDPNATSQNSGGAGQGNNRGRGGRGRGGGPGRGRGGGGNNNTVAPPQGFDHPMGAPASCAAQARLDPSSWKKMADVYDRMMAEHDAKKTAADEAAVQERPSEGAGDRAENAPRTIVEVATTATDTDAPLAMIAKTYSSCPANMSERWLFDTGSDIHIVNDKSWFMQGRCAPIEASNPIMTGGGPVYPTMIGLAEVPLQTGDATHPQRKIQLQYAVLVEKFPINIFSGERLFLAGGYMSKKDNKSVVFDANGTRITQLNIPDWGFFMPVAGQALPMRKNHVNQD